MKNHLVSRVCNSLKKYCPPERSEGPAFQQFTPPTHTPGRMRTSDSGHESRVGATVPSGRGFRPDFFIKTSPSRSCRIGHTPVFLLSNHPTAPSVNPPSPIPPSFPPNFIESVKYTKIHRSILQPRIRKHHITRHLSQIHINGPPSAHHRSNIGSAQPPPKGINRSLKLRKAPTSNPGVRSRAKILSIH